MLKQLLNIKLLFVASLAVLFGWGTISLAIIALGG